MLLIESMLMAGATGPVPPPPLSETGFLYVWGAGADNRGPAPGSTVFSWTAIQAGTYSVAGIRNDGTLWTWGTGSYGNLGQGVLTRVLSPVQVGSSSWTAVSTNQVTFLALRQDSTLWSWGRNNNGQAGSYTNPSLSWTTVSSGYYHSVGITSDGGLYAWGNDKDSGVIGQGVSPISAQYLVPKKIGQSSWTAVTAGRNFSVAIRQDGTMWSWGVNSLNHLGLGDTTPRSSPTQIGASSWSVVNSNEAFTMAIRQDGRLFTWGTNSYGQGGDPSIVSGTINSPTQIGTSSWTAVAAGQRHALAIRQDGALFAWGRANSGQLGVGPGVATSWTQLLLDDSWGIGLRNDGAVLTWGYANWQGVPTGRAWSGTTSTPTILTASGVQGSSFTAIAANISGGAAIRQDGRLFTWGFGQFGFLGQNSTSSIYSPVSVGTSSWTAVQVGSWHMLAIRQDGGLFAWGRNQYGQLGDGTTINRSSPVQIGSSSWTALGRAGMRNNISMAIRQDRGLFSWGRNFSGVLGLNDNTNRSSPTQVGTSSWTMVAHSESHSVGIRHLGSLFAWGLNSSGQLGDGSTTNRSSPVSIGSSSWTTVSAGASHTAGITQGGNLFTWGSGNQGALGQGNTTARSSPIQVGSSSWSAVSAGNNACLGILNGAGFGWGSNLNGQLGLGTSTNTFSSPVALYADPPANRSSPVQIGTSSWTQVSAGGSFSVAIRQGGSLFTWGINQFGQLGLGNYTQQFSPTQVGTGSWVQVRAMRNGVLARNADSFIGSVWGWGQNNVGELGLNDTSTRTTPTQQNLGSFTQVGTGGDGRTGFRISPTGALVGFGLNNNRQVGGGALLTATGVSSPTAIGNTLTDPLVPYQISTSSWTAIASGNNTSLAIRQGGSLFAWGEGSTGKLGLGDTTTRSSPTQVGTSSWTAVSTNYFGGFAIRQDGGLFSWGINYGNLGLGDNSARSSPTQVGTSSWTAVSTQYNHVLALRQDRTLWGFGGNQNGQLAITTTLHSWTAVSMGQYFVAAIRNDGGLYVWGANGQGQLGQGDTTQRNSPVQVGTSSWSAVAAGVRFTLAIRQDGALFSWGYGGNGALGSGSLASRSSPVQVGTSSWTAVTAGNYHGSAIRQDGSVFTWGSNAFGQLGQGNQTDFSSPVQVGTSSWSAIAAGYNRLLAIRQDGGLFAWGSNDNGELGLNDTAARSSPVQVGTSSWTVVTSANNHSGAIRQGGSLFMWGFAAQGQLGNGTTGPKQSSPVQIGTSSWTTVSAARDSAQAIRSDSTLWAWGRNRYGRLGLGTSVYGVSSPVQIGTGTWSGLTRPNNSRRNMFEITADKILFGQGGNAYGVLRTPGFSSPVSIGNEPITPISVPTQISTSSWTVIRGAVQMSQAIRQDGRLFSWGLGTSGRLGLGSVGSVYSPTQVGTSSWTALGSNVNGTAILSNGLAYMWGQGSSGQLGNNSTDSLFSPNLLGNIPLNSSSPTVLGSSSWRFLAMADSHTAAIDSNYKLYTWGTNNRGQLGLGDYGSRSQPTQVGTSSWIAVDCGSYGDSRWMLGLRADGTLWTWGRGYQGQLGLNEVEGGSNKSSPTQIGASSWSAVAAGKQSYAIRQDGALFAWGPALLGLGDYSLQSSPTQIGTSSWTTVSAGNKAGMAIRQDSRLFVWGYNQNGQLGDGTPFTNRATPVEISGGGSWTAVSMSKSGQHAIGITSDGLVYAWGRNTYGQLGMGNTTNYPYPVYQFGLTGSWTAVNAGNDWAAAVGRAGQLWVWGRNQYGQLGDGTTINRSLPVQVGSATNWVNNSTRVIAGTTNIGGAFRQT